MSEEREIIHHTYDGGEEIPLDIITWWDDVWRKIGEVLEERECLEDGTRIRSLALRLEAGEPVRVLSASELGEMEDIGLEEVADAYLKDALDEEGGDG